MPGSKTISERLRERANSASGPRSLVNRAAFLAIREEVADAIRDGWSVRRIWELLQEDREIAVGYVRFTQLVRQYIHAPARTVRRPNGEPALSNSADARRASAAAQDRSPPVEKAPVTPPKGGIGQTFTVKPTPNKEDLI
jgi:hypothetical protein